MPEKVFALGDRRLADDQAESGYFVLRIALTEALKGAVGRGLAVLPGFIGTIAAPVGRPVALKLSAQAAPVVGAAGGAAVNLAFLEHFWGWTRRVSAPSAAERLHNPALVRAGYEALRVRSPVELKVIRLGGRIRLAIARRSQLQAPDVPLHWCPGRPDPAA